VTEEIPDLPVPPPVDPAAVGPDAVKTVGGRKYGWQQPPTKLDTDDPATCAHTGLTTARNELKADPAARPIGDIWLCVCGQEFEVVLGDGGNKILCPKEPTDGPEAEE
jgi:hypothetical protein